MEHYDFTTKSIPAQTSPNKIIVLSQQESEMINIIVDDIVIDVPSAYINEEGVVMVPVRGISEELGYEVSWNLSLFIITHLPLHQHKYTQLY
ncbi:MAG: stalk domain-containing protein [Sedimentibacter sp.]